MGFNLKRGDFRLGIKGELFTQRTGRPWHCCPQLRVLHPWRCPGPWMGSGQAELVRGTQLTAGMGLGVVRSPSYPTILLFYDPMICTVKAEQQLVSP